MLKHVGNAITHNSSPNQTKQCTG